jgi:hypothetical protein
MTEQQQTCREPIGEAYSTRVRHCGRPVKEDGLCGIHLAARRRRAKNQRAREDRRARNNRIKDEADARANELQRLAGVSSSPSASMVPPYGYTGGLRLSAEEVDRLLQRLRDLGALAAVTAPPPLPVDCDHQWGDGTGPRCSRCGIRRSSAHPSPPPGCLTCRGLGFTLASETGDAKLCWECGGTGVV